MSGDQARVTVHVAVARAVAFRIFTEEIDQWWRRGPKYRHFIEARALICIEPRRDGRVFESVQTAEGETVFEAGRILVWEPPERLVFSWRLANFAPDEVTEVEIGFAQTTNGTSVTVTHRGWSSLREGHPARHGRVGAEFARDTALWWGGQMSAYRDRASPATGIR
jgi:uncharacterized protein YndB with AHSA1/START domain